MSPCKPLVPTAHSRTGTGDQSEQVHPRENPLTDSAPLSGICCCHSLCLIQPLEPEQLHILTQSYLLPLQGAFLDFPVVIWLVHLDPRQFFFAAAPCFHHNFDLVARGMNRASIIYIIFFLNFL
uniref:Uncharacterized protein n=1 Tax=Rousettus aegyptiacus TaxID=9407 RepID=A0A7J8H178_ROUAE|nr:hypothetical protein HJG63_011349 [Rousettus aegyptiacus]